MKLYLYLLATIISLVFATNRDRYLRDALEDYVDERDNSYTWRVDSTFRGPTYTVHVLNMTSQRYVPPGGANPTLWRHWVSICVPDNLDRIKARTGFVYIDGGRNTDRAPTSWTPDRFGYTEEICKGTQQITVHLGQVPQQPYFFADTPATPREEDDILAYGWNKFLNDTDEPLWITRLAMVKSAVRAMDATQDFARSLPGRIRVNNFIVGGASKRGWATWLTGAVDRRVKAIIPIVLPIQKVNQNIAKIWRCYNGWGFALQDYVNNRIPQRLFTPEFEKLMLVEDPFTYNRDLDMPKLVIIGTKDEFFLPDAPKEFYKDLVGEKHLVAVPNGPHGAVGSRSSAPEPFYYIANTSIAFINRVTLAVPRPDFRFKLNYSNGTASVEVWTLSAPRQVRLWQGTPPNTGRRDFRQVMDPFPTFNIYQYTSVTLNPILPGYYKGEVSAPAAGWTAFFIDASFGSGNQRFTVTSEVNIVPDRYPFPSCWEVGAC